MQFHICANRYGHHEVQIQCLSPFCQNLGGQPKSRSLFLDVGWIYAEHGSLPWPTDHLCHLTSSLKRQALVLNSRPSESELVLVGPEDLYF